MWDRFSKSFLQHFFFHDLFFFALSLDPEQKDQLIEVIEKLLADKTTVGFCTTDPVFEKNTECKNIGINFYA